MLISYHFIRGYGSWEARKSGKSGEVGSQDSQHGLAFELAPLRLNRLIADIIGPSSRVCMNLSLRIAHSWAKKGENVSTVSCLHWSRVLQDRVHCKLARLLLGWYLGSSWSMTDGQGPRNGEAQRAKVVQRNASCTFWPCIHHRQRVFRRHVRRHRFSNRAIFIKYFSLKH